MSSPSPGAVERQLAALADAVILGNRAGALDLVKALLESGVSHQVILEQGVTVGMSVVGERVTWAEFLIPGVFSVIGYGEDAVPHAYQSSGMAHAGA